MLHKNTYILLLVLSSFSTIGAQKSTQNFNLALAVDEYNLRAGKIEKIESKILDLERKKSILNVLINPMRCVAVLLTLRAGFSLVGKLCGLASISDHVIFETACFSVPLLLALDKALNMSKDWTKKDIDDLQKELEHLNDGFVSHI